MLLKTTALRVARRMKEEGDETEGRGVDGSFFIQSSKQAKAFTDGEAHRQAGNDAAEVALPGVSQAVNSC